jgi:acetylglutamate kinase
VNPPLVLKLGGELLETGAQRERLAAVIAELASTRPLVVVHGGGRAIDAELERHAIAPRKIDGLRITDEATRDIVVSVLAGSANTALVASLVGRGVPAVGLTGVDAGFAPALRRRHRAVSGELVDLGFVGDPVDADPSLIQLLVTRGYVPVIASLGVDGGTILNVNADVMAGRIAAALEGAELVIAGGTAGVLDANGGSIATLDADGIERMIASATATAGMITKLEACREALRQGVRSVRIVDGSDLDAGRPIESARGTTVVLQATLGRPCPPSREALRRDLDEARRAESGRAGASGGGETPPYTRAR